MNTTKLRIAFIALVVGAFVIPAAQADQIGTGKPETETLWDTLMQPIYELFQPSAETATVGDSGDDQIGTGKP